MQKYNCFPEFIAKQVKTQGTSIQLNIVQYENIMPLKGTTAFLSLELNREMHEAQT